MEECEKCQDSGYIEKVSGGVWTGEGLQSRQVLCDCACGRDARDQEEGKRLHAPMTTETPPWMTPPPDDADIVAVLEWQLRCEASILDAMPQPPSQARRALDEITRLRAQLTAATADADALRVQLAQTIMQQDEAWQAMKERAEQAERMLTEAADEITRLRAENAELQSEVRRQKMRGDDHWRNAKELATRVADLQRKLDEAVSPHVSMKLLEAMGLDAAGLHNSLIEKGVIRLDSDGYITFITSIRREA